MKPAAPHGAEFTFLRAKHIAQTPWILTCSTLRLARTVFSPTCSWSSKKPPAVSKYLQKIERR